MIRKDPFRLVALAALVAVPAGSIVYDVPTDAELVERTPLIVYGEVEFTAVAADGQNTDAVVRIERVLKGSAKAGTVLVRQPGAGTVRVMGLRMLRKGDTGLFFLAPAETGIYRTVDLGLGIFREDRAHLVRDVGESGFRSTERFSQWIVDRDSGIERPEDYLVDSIPGPRGVAQEATWIRDWGCGLREYPPAGYSYEYRGYEGICYKDSNGNGYLDPVETFDDDNGDGEWNPGERFNDRNGNGVLDDPEEIVDCLPGPYDATKQRYDSQGHFYYVDADDSETYNPDATTNPDEVKVTGDAIDFRYVRWPHWNQTVTSSSRAANGSARLDAVNAAIRLWNNDGGSSVALPLATEAEFSIDRTKVWKNRLGVDFDVPDLCAVSWDLNDNEVWVPSCSSVLALAMVTYVCEFDGTSTLHGVPGGTGQAHRIDVARVYLSSDAVSSDDPGRVGHLLAHELGHALGIHHSDSDDTADVMDAVYSTALSALSADDRLAVRKLYPAVSGGGAPPPGGGAPPGGDAVPSEPEPPPPPPPVPPVASFTVDMPCADGLCSARTGEDITFTDTSSGTVARRSWDFETTDRTPSGKSVTHTWSSPGFYRSTLTVEGAGAESTSARMFRVDAASPAGSCVPGPETACLQDSRFEIEVEWQGADGASNAARVVHAGTNDSGLFSFFDRDNWEMLVKVLDGCSINGHHWVYAASATTQPFEISITDTETGEVYRYVKGADELAALADPAAFTASCGGEPSR